MKTKVKGITLIALVITIIVLLILAGVTVATLTGENGLLSRAQLAKEKIAEKEAEENEILSTYENELNNYGTWERTGGSGNTTSSGRYFTQNYAIVGSTVISKGVVSGFSTSSYLILPETFNPGSNSWEMVIKLKTTSDINDEVPIITGKGNSKDRSIILTQKNGQLQICLSSNSSNWNVAFDEKIIDISVNTTYYAKIVYDGNKYECFISNDGNNYESKLEINNSNPIYQNQQLLIGCARDNSNYFPGSVDLKESYIKINGQLWWDCWME